MSFWTSYIFGYWLISSDLKHRGTEGMEILCDLLASVFQNNEYQYFLKNV